MRLPNISLELTKDQHAAVCAKLSQFAASKLSISDKVVAWALHFFGTPYEFESQLAPLDTRTLRVRLASFDCITFVYTVIALARSESWEEFVQELALLRYDVEDPANIDNRTEGGNFLDFASEALLLRAIKRGVLTDVTAAMALPIQTLSAKLQRHIRWSLGSREQEMIAPRFGERSFAYDFISPDDLLNAPDGCLRDGDILVFSRTRARPPLCLVSHAAVFHQVDGKMCFIHSSRGVVAPHSRRRNSAFTGLYVDPENLFEQIGVWHGLEYAGDEHSFERDGLNFFSYMANSTRELIDYASENYEGMCVLRVQKKHPVPPLSYLAYDQVTC